MNLLLILPIILFSFPSVLVFAESEDDKDLFLYVGDKEVIPLDVQPVDGFLEIIVRDSNGRLISYLKTDNLHLSDLEIAKNFVDNWPIKKVITRNDGEFKVLQRVTTQDIDYGKAIGDTGIYLNLEEIKIWILMALHNQFLVEKGDTVTNIYTIFRPVD